MGRQGIAAKGFSSCRVRVILEGNAARHTVVSEIAKSKRPLISSAAFRGWPYFCERVTKSEEPPL
jgi:hypothetical protein